ncbi:CDP-diacylglycerol--glycerol-3-phosphate 3-phosphatidyltransferase [Bacteroidales bacterium Barb4]|nr:CDP-diacylglycerol--glycerol-3-phosphate 3-phosphatidyltransferase [Bacteroidales bacterium Barb4]
MNKEYEASLKSIETENVIDKLFYRRIGFVLARQLMGTGVTPNMITVVSIFVGVAAGILFYPDNLGYNLCGILCLVIANILDCADGQLARLAGIKSEIGRILDGVAGDIWFLAIYLGLAFRLHDMYAGYDLCLFIGIALLSGFSHLFQANITDYYKTLHLFFISKDKGAEFQTAEEVIAKHKAFKPGLNKVFFLLYRWYTLAQVNATPSLQQMLHSLKSRYGDDIPETVRLSFRRQSLRLMTHYVDLLTFNGRTIILFIVVLTGYVQVYFLYEIVVLNIVLAIAMRKHEKMCAAFVVKQENEEDSY